MTKNMTKMGDERGEAGTFEPLDASFIRVFIHLSVQNSSSQNVKVKIKGQGHFLGGCDSFKSLETFATAVC